MRQQVRQPLLQSGMSTAIGFPDVLVDDGRGHSFRSISARPGERWIPNPKQISIGGTYSGAIALGDLNDDGKSDMVVANAAFANFSVALGNGDGTFGTPAVYSTGLPSADAVVIGDFNRDGRQDVAVSGYSAVAIFFGNGDGTFQPGGIFNVGFVPMWMASGDFNGDGALDLAVSNVGGSSVSVLLGNGDGTFKAAKNYRVKSPGQVISVDLNHDGILDLVVTNRKSLAVFFGKGDGTFLHGKSIPIAASLLAALDRRWGWQGRSGIYDAGSTWRFFG